jgi:hypothetical protein
MSTARLGSATLFRPERLAPALGKLLAVAIILTPLVAMLFPELNHRSGSTPPSGTQVSRVHSLTSSPTLTPMVFQRRAK